METGDCERRHTLWLALTAALLILAIAQADEHRRFRRAQHAYLEQLAARAAQSAAYLDQMNEFLSKPPHERAAVPMPPPHFPEKTPPEPRRERYMLVARIRHAVCFGAFTVAAAMPIVWALATPPFARRNRRLIAEATLALALFGTIGMLLGPGRLANWNTFRIGADAAGYGLVLVPLGVVAVVLAARVDAAELSTGEDNAGVDAGDVDGGAEIGTGSNT